MSTVFITGAGGFVGAALAARLRAAGHEVRGVDLVADPAAGIVAGDIGAPGAWQDHVDGCDLVVHTAAVVSNTVDLPTMWRINVLGTRHVLDAAVRAGARRIVSISSIRAFSDHGFPDGVTEDFPVQPDGNPYVDTKIAGEQVILQAHAAGEIEAVVVRPGDVYGPASRPWTIIPVELIKANQFLLPAMGGGIFSPIYIDDLVTGLVLAAEHPAAAGQVFTLTSGERITCKEFFGHYYRMLNKRGPFVVPNRVAVTVATAAALAAKVSRKPNEVNADSMLYLARAAGYSNEKAMRVLGFEPSVDLAEGMARTHAWLVEQHIVPRPQVSRPTTIQQGALA